MESFLGFREPPAEEVVFDQSHSLKLVPWISWEEWNFVRDSLFSSSPQSVASALQRITTWRSRGCLPVLIDVTAVFIEIQQKDPFFRDDFSDRAVESEEMLATLYCMAIVRLVNVAIEKTRKKTEISIAEAANAKSIPRMLIDIRHECSHRDLPSLQLVRLASMKALDWLKSYYWEPQKNAIPTEGDLMANIRKKIKHRLRELAICLKVKQIRRSGSSLVKGKRTKHLEPLCGPNKFLSVMAINHTHAKTSGSKKQVRKALNIVLGLYSSYSMEVVDVLFELLLKFLKSSELVEHLENPQSSKEVDYMPTLFDEWKSVIKKLSSKEPGLLWILLKLVLEKILIHEARKQEIDEDMFFQHTTESLEMEPLASLFEWLVQILGSRRPAQLKGTAAEIESMQKYFPEAAILELLRKCLVACSPGNKPLMTSALVLADMLGNQLLNDKLAKLLSLNVSDLDVSEAVPPDTSLENFLSREKEAINLAAKSLELIKLRRRKSTNLKPTEDHVEINIRWTIAKSWNPCPIGTLPHSHSSSGCLPVLDCNADNPETSKLSNSENQWELNRGSANREAQGAVELVEDVTMKSMRETVEGCEVHDNENTCSEGIKGHLLIDGVWRRVTDEELLAIASNIRILV